MFCFIAKFPMCIVNGSGIVATRNEKISLAIQSTDRPQWFPQGRRTPFLFCDHTQRASAVEKYNVHTYFYRTFSSIASIKFTSTKWKISNEPKYVHIHERARLPTQNIKWICCAKRVCAQPAHLKLYVSDSRIYLFVRHAELSSLCVFGIFVFQATIRQ